jgi:hypothetical protein
MNTPLGSDGEDHTRDGGATPSASGTPSVRSRVDVLHAPRTTEGIIWEPNHEAWLCQSISDGFVICEEVLD